MAKGKSLAFSPPVINNTDIALLQYTGGTTGLSKGAVLSHANLLANTAQLDEQLRGVHEKGVEIYVAPLPLYHIYAFQLHLLCMASIGAFSLLIPDPRDIRAFVKSIRRFKITGFLGINTLFNALCQDEDFRQLDFSALKSTTSGGMALTHDVARRWQAVTGCQVCEGYGMTEASPVICCNTPTAIQLETVGKPLPRTELKVVNSDGLALAEGEEGEEGELWVRGPQVMLEYWQHPEETAVTLTSDGWLKTGDVAIIQADGFVKIVDRLKDMIIVSGFNVFPNEVEDVLASHPEIIESAVIGV